MSAFKAGVRERRAIDRPLKRMRQLQARLDALLRDARDLRQEALERTRAAVAVSQMIRRKRPTSA